MSLTETHKTRWDWKSILNVPLNETQKTTWRGLIHLLPWSICTNPDYRLLHIWETDLNDVLVTKTNHIRLKGKIFATYTSKISQIPLLRKFISAWWKIMQIKACYCTAKISDCCILETDLNDAFVTKTNHIRLKGKSSQLFPYLCSSGNLDSFVPVEKSYNY